MPKVPFVSSWHVGSSSCETNPQGSRLECNMLTIRLGCAMSEDTAITSGCELHFKVGGEAPSERDQAAGVGHITGDVADAIFKLNEFLIPLAIKTKGYTQYKDLPKEVQAQIADPSIPVMPPELVEKQALFEAQKLVYETKLAAKLSGDPNWMHAVPNEETVKRVASVMNPVYMAASSGIQPVLLREGRPFLNRIKKLFSEPWVYAGIPVAIVIAGAIYLLLK